MAKWIVFFDTNILLDFYRLGNESAKRQVTLLRSHADALILTDQVWMEFLKNRQKVVQEGISALKKPAKQTVPAVLDGTNASKMHIKSTKEALKRHQSILDQLGRVISNPEKHDPIYKNLKKLFEGDWEYSLRRPNKKRYEVRRLARKRFFLGYPPGKRSDLSMGDAINWEWIISCAQDANDRPNVMIVTRDTDYGIKFDNEMVLNDWLKREFKERVSRQRQIEITNRMSVALKRLDERLIDEDEKAEEELIKSTPDSNYSSGKVLSVEELVNMLFADVKKADDVDRDIGNQEVESDDDN